MAKSQELYFGGVPTIADVERLREKFGVPKEGQVITYEEVAKIIGSDRHSNRFRSVTSSWRKRLFVEHNVALGARANIGFEVLHPDERVSTGVGLVRGGLRRFRRSNALITTTDKARLSDEQVKRADHTVRICAAVLQAQLTEARRYHGPALPSAIEK